MNVSRRNFLKAGLSSLAYFSTVGTTPLWITKAAEALCFAPFRRLVIIQQAGGNDGLNTVIPYTDPVYTGSQLLNGAEIRPKLKILEPNLTLTKLGDDLNAFHPKLIRLTDWYKNGNMAIIQNVGYPNPNLSHFQSTDFWEQGRSPGSSQTALTGWVSRFFDNTCTGVDPDNIDPLAMVAAGRTDVPPALVGSPKFLPPSVEDFLSYKVAVDSDPKLGPHQKTYIKIMNNLPVIDPEKDFIQRAAINAQASAVDMAVASTEPDLNVYPDTELGNGLNIVSKIIRAGFGTRIFYVYQGGYDNHANQFGSNPITEGEHPALLEEFDQSVDSFMKDLHQSGRLHDTLVMTFSEFGRRLFENGSSGTDHGAGNCLFVLGGRALRPGIYGGQPNLANPLNNNLRHSIDYRSVFSRVIMDWFESDPVSVFGAADFFDPVMKIDQGLPLVNFLDPMQFATPATNRYGQVAAVGLAAAAGALAIQQINKRFDDNAKPIEINSKSA